MNDCKDCLDNNICEKAEHFENYRLEGCKDYRRGYHLPCKIGDKVWAIKKYNGVYVTRQGIVSKMFFVGEKMELCIVVKSFAGGTWGREIFPTQEEAERALLNEN